MVVSVSADFLVSVSGDLVILVRKNLVFSVSEGLVVSFSEALEASVSEDLVVSANEDFNFNFRDLLVNDVYTVYFLSMIDYFSLFCEKRETRNRTVTAT